MIDLLGTAPADVVATWVAAIATVVVLGGLLGERRLFGWSQHLLAGLVTGFLALLAVTEVIVPRVVAPLVADPAGRPELAAGLILVAAAAGAPWLPRIVAAVPVSIGIGALAAFALGGAVIGTLLPQLAATIVGPGSSPLEIAAAAASALVTIVVLVAFLRGTPRGRALGAAMVAGRGLLLIGIGAWIGVLVLSRLVLLSDRIGFLVGDWLGLR
jgi:hypothetical protein